MEKLLLTFGCAFLVIWIWFEYFREIPHLEEVGVLKNFRVVSVKPSEATYTVLEKNFVTPQSGPLYRHSTSVNRGYRDLAYVSNIDVLLAQPNWSNTMSFHHDSAKRCYSSEQSLSEAQRLDSVEHTEHFSLIAASEQVANRIRRIKAGQKIHLKGDYVKVFNEKDLSEQFLVGLGSDFSSRCQIFRVHDLKQLDD